jgi:eukaryotic-like serine/threonine-protein kinase
VRMSALAPGVLLNNRFTLRGVIGAGGMAEVWRADDVVLGRPVAVKVLTAALAGDPAFRSATFTEARAAARLAHPHVTQIYDYGETTLPDGTVIPYLVMELVEGPSLADRLLSGPLPWRQAVAITAQVASALAAAHRLGIVHRDIKPGNVMLTSAGAKVLDFGIAAWAGAKGNADGGRLVGTPAYAAPERLRPDPPTPASDVYALGALLYEALTGRQPMAAVDWQQAADAHRAGTPPAPPDAPGLPRQIRRLCMACLAPDPAQRPTAEALARDLAIAAGHRPVAADAVAPTMAADRSPTLVASPAAAGYAMGAARLPHPRTVIDPGISPAVPEPKRLPRLLLGLVVAAVLVATVAAIAVANMISSGGSKQASPPLTSPSSDAAAPSPTPSTGKSTTTTTATSPQAIIDQLNATIDSALAGGKIDGDTADSLRDKVKDVAESLNGGGDHGKKHKVGEKVQELLQRINELLNDGKIDQETADQLNAIIQPLTGAA